MVLKDQMKKNRIVLVLAAIVLLELMLLVYYNIFHIQDALEDDFAKLLRHVIEMGRHRRLFLEDWDYITTGEFDCSALLAALFYIFIGNVYLSYALSNIVNIALWLIVLITLLRRMGLDHLYQLLTIGLVFLAYAFGSLEYTNMMFFAGGQYAWKTIIPLLGILVVSSDKSNSNGLLYLWIPLFYILLFFSCLSSGLYVIVCGIFPIIICVIVFLTGGYLKEKKRYLAFIGACTLAVGILGIVINKRMHIDETIYELQTPETIFNSIFTACGNFVSVFCPSSSSVKAVSAIGIMQMICFLIVCFFVVFGMRSLEKAGGFQIYRSFGLPEDTESTELIMSCLISISIWNFLVLLLTSSSPRYHLISAIPLIICAVYNLRSYLKDGRKILFLSEKSIITMFCCYLLLQSFFSLWQTRRYDFHDRDEERAIIDQVIELMDKYDAQTVFFDDSPITEDARVMETERVVETYYPTNNEVVNYDFYVHDRDRSAFSDRNILVMSSDSAESFPVYISENYQKIADIDGYGIWYNDNCPIDGLNGFPTTDRSVDLPSSRDYQSVGVIDGGGHLHTNETGMILASPGLYSDGSREYSASVNYEIEPGTETYIEVYYNYELLDRMQLDDHSQKIDIQIPNIEGEYIISIVNETPGNIEIGEIEFKAKQ